MTKIAPLPLLKVQLIDSTWCWLTDLISVQDLSYQNYSDTSDDVEVWAPSAELASEPKLRLLSVERLSEGSEEIYGFLAKRIYLVNGANGSTIDSL